MLSARRILVPTDFSRCSEVALEYAEDLALHTGAAIDVLHVWDTPLYATSGLSLYLPEQMVCSTLAAMRQDAREELDEFISRVVKSEVAVRPFLRIGVPTEEILKRAESGGYNLIVIGTNGRTGLAHMLLRSVAERVVRQSPCPVLTIRVVEEISTAAA